MGLETKWLQEGKEIAPIARACLDEDGSLQGNNFVTNYCMMGKEDLGCPYVNNRFVIHNDGDTFPHCLYQREEYKK